MFSTRNNTLLSVLFFSLLVLFSCRAYAEPMWSGAVNATFDNYTNLNSTFLVTWFNATNSSVITEVNITANFTGSLSSYSMVLISGDNTNGAYGFGETLGAGNFMWKSCANDSEGNFSCTGYYNFTISKASNLPLHLYLNGTEGNRTNTTGYKLNDVANFSVFLGTSGLAYNLTNNMTYINSSFTYFGEQKNSTNTTTDYIQSLNKTGFFYVEVNWSGDQNYSEISKTYYFTVTDLNWSSDIITVASPVQYLALRNYSFQINLTGDVSNVSFEWNDNSTKYVVQKNSSTYWVNLTDLAATNYSYRWYANDTNNIFSYTDYSNYNITKIPTITSISATPTSVAVSGAISISCSVTPTAGLTVMLTEGVGVCSGTNSFSSCALTAPSVANSYSYTCTGIGNENYSSSLLSQIILVSTTATNSNPGSNPGTSSESFLIKYLTPALSVNAGQSGSATFTISNTLKNSMANISISVTGIDSSWYTLSNKTIPLINGGISKPMTITFNISSSIQSGNYSVTIIATGKEWGGSLKTATMTMTLTVVNNGPQPIAPLNITGTLPAAQEQAAANDSAKNQENSAQTQENSHLYNSTSVLTGLMPSFEYVQNNLVFIVAVAACLLIFIFRNSITMAMKRDRDIIQREIKKENMSMPNLSKYKLTIGLRKEDEQGSVIRDEPKDKRPEVLEREIKRDIKELKSVLEAEKKIGKRKPKIENN